MSLWKSMRRSEEYIHNQQCCREGVMKERNWQERLAIESVNNLSNSSQKVLEFLDNQVASDYKAQVGDWQSI